MTSLPYQSPPSEESKPVFVEIGEFIRVELPPSDVCRSMGVSYQERDVQLVATRALEGGAMAQLYDDDGAPFSIPILPGEAGIYTMTTAGGSLRYYVPRRFAREREFAVRYFHTGKVEATYRVRAFCQAEAEEYVFAHRLELSPEDVTPLADDYQQYL